MCVRVRVHVRACVCVAKVRRNTFCLSPYTFLIIGLKADKVILVLVHNNVCDYERFPEYN